MRTGIVVNVTPEDRRRLEAIVSDRDAPQKYVWRAKIIWPLPTTAERPRGGSLAAVKRRKQALESVHLRVAD